MPKLHTMPLYVEDLLSDAAVDQMDAATFGAYMRLLCYAWKEGGIPDDQERLRNMGSEPPAIRTPDQFFAFISSELKTYTELVKRSGAKAD